MREKMMTHIGWEKRDFTNAATIAPQKTLLCQLYAFCMDQNLISWSLNKINENRKTKFNFKLAYSPFSRTYSIGVDCS